MTTSQKRPVAILQAKRYRKIGDFILKVRTLIVNISNNVALFATPLPTTMDVGKHTDDLETAEAVAKTRLTGSVADRDLKYDVVLDDVHNWINYVQTLADNAVDEATAVLIIESSGFDLKKKGVRVKAPLEAKQGDVSGSVKLTARSQGRASYQWQKSSDGIVFTNLPSTLQAKTMADGFTPGTAVYFRCRSVTKSGEGDWTSVVSLTVL